MTSTFRLPDLGEGIAEGEVISWHVEVGDEVVEEDPLIEVETDKALVEIPSPMTGRVTELHVQEGEIVPVGIDLLTYEEAGNAGAAADIGDAAVAAEPEAQPSEADAPSAFARPSTRRLARELGVGLDRVTGSGPAGRITDEDVRSAAEHEPEPDDETPVDSPGQTAPAGRERTLAAPSVRRLAAELDVDIDTVPASGQRDGQDVVTAADVRAFADADEAIVEESTTEGDRREPYRGIRRSIGETMTDAWKTIPHATHYDDMDAGALVALREDLKPLAQERDIRLTYLPFVMLAVVSALEDHPSLNAMLDEEAEEVVFRREYHIGFAADTDSGLVVPVVKHADRKGLFELAREIEELATSARDRSIAVEDLRGGTFTITNIGGIGGHFATPIVNPPEVGILALGAIRNRPWVVDDEVVPRPVLPLSLSLDHRVVDGADAARFANEVKNYLGRPAELLVD